MIMAKDFRGQTPEQGDRAVYVTTGRYATRAIVEVIEVKKRVKVRFIETDRTQYGQNEPFWADASSLFLIDKFKGE